MRQQLAQAQHHAIDKGQQQVYRRAPEQAPHRRPAVYDHLLLVASIIVLAIVIVVVGIGGRPRRGSGR